MIDPFMLVVLLLIQVVFQWGIAFLFIVLIKKYLGKSIKKGVGSVGESIKDRLGSIQQSFAGSDDSKVPEDPVE
ncbi:MAG: hypothetical protein JJE29_00385 [Peptostreptococcaceae bacterium]|nr:hypothetical protein [Peptostreptococcaceae bacterium]